MRSPSASRPRADERGIDEDHGGGSLMGAGEVAPGFGTIAPVAETSNGMVLVVDDEPTIVEVVARYLERAGYATLEAADGLEALRLAEARDPDLIVLDVMLPG